MKDLIWINDARYLGDYSLMLTFNDGEQRKVDLINQVCDAESYLSSLSNKELFKDFKLDGWTVTWMDGLLDIAPERLYELATTEA